MHTLPLPFITRMQQDLGDQWPDFEKALDAPPPISVRNHFFKEKKWKEISGKVKWSSNGVYLLNRPIFTLDPGFHAGSYYVQEASSMLLEQAVRQSVELSQPLRALDLAAAPGGKSTLLAELLSADSLLIANEVIRSRYSVLRYNLQKWGYANNLCSNHDSRDFGEFKNWFDLVVLDAPCSGEGLFRKDPEAVKEWSEEAVHLCSARQRRILAEAVELVRPGGILIYSTCTYNTAENGENVRWIESEFDFTPLPIHLPEDWRIEAVHPGYQCYPHQVKGEGFYIAILQKKGETAIPGIPKPLSVPGWEALPGKLLPLVRPWLHTPERFHFFIDAQQQIRAIPKTLVPWVTYALAKLRRCDWGIEVGTIKGNELIPAPELALSLFISKELPGVELDRHTALLFLKKEQIKVSGAPLGWCLARYEGLNLGWMKVLKDRINNYYPKNWRILMDISGERNK